MHRTDGGATAEGEMVDPICFPNGAYAEDLMKSAVRCATDKPGREGQRSE